MDTCTWTVTLPSEDIPYEDETHTVVFLVSFWEAIQEAVRLFTDMGHGGRMWWVGRSSQEIRLQGEIMRALKETGQRRGGPAQRIQIHDPVCLTIAFTGTAPVWSLIPVVIRALVSQGVIVSPAQIIQVLCEQVLPASVGSMDEIRIGLVLNPNPPVVCTPANVEEGREIEALRARHVGRTK